MIRCPVFHRRFIQEMTEDVIQLDLDRVHGAGRFVMNGTREKKTLFPPNSALLRKNRYGTLRGGGFLDDSQIVMRAKRTNKRYPNSGTKERQRRLETGIRRVGEARRRYARHTRNL